MVHITYIMDGTLQNPNYRGLSPDEGFEVIKNHIKTIKKYNGIFTFLWHNSSFDPVGWQGWKEVYENVMEYISDQNAFVASGREII